MARRSLRNSTGSKATAVHKRTVSSTAEPGPAANTKKAKTAKSTPTKSQYFNDDSKGKSKVDDSEEELSSPAEDEDSVFDEEEADSGDPSLSGANESDDESDAESEDDAPKSRKKPAKSKQPQSSGVNSKTSQLWRESVKTGLGPGTQVIIKKPKARPAGKTAYTDESIHPNTFLFLTDLKANNNREWLKMHDPDFRQSERDWHSFVEKLTERLVEIDDTIPELPVKDIIFRIYRDIRFSSDPTPYKPYFSAAWSRTGRKGPFAAYYVQISPNNGTFVGGGLWHPEAPRLAAMRASIDRRPRRLKDILLDPRMRKEYLEGASKDDEKVVKAFVAANAESALKTKPKGYTADHPEIELLRLKSFTVGKKLKDEEVLGANGMKRIAELFSAMKPFIEYLNGVVMPDEESADEEEDSEESEGGEEEEDEDAGSDEMEDE